MDFASVANSADRVAFNFAFDNSVRQVAIDDDWSALRFRRVEFTKQ
jgi:hypothetical protein